MNIYSSTAMLAVLRSLRPEAPRFLLDVFFPGAVFSDTEEIMFDVEVDDIEIAPFVSPLAAGRIGADRGYETKLFKPAYVKPMNDIKPNEPLRRMMGERIGGEMTAAERERAILGMKLEDQMNRIIRRKEVMASEVLRTGQLVVSGPDYPAVTVDFQRPAGHTVALSGAARWGETGVSPVDNVTTWADTVATACGAAPDRVVMTTDAWTLFRKDPQVATLLDTTLGQQAAVDLGFQPGAPGTATFRGRIGALEFWTYNDTYKVAGGAAQMLLPAHTVLIIATRAAEGTQSHGAILDPAAGYRSVEMFPKSWIEENPGRRVLLTQSAPLVFARRPAATLCATVR